MTAAVQQAPRDTTSYNARVMIGNYFEDRELQRTLLKGLVARKMTGTLKLDAFHQKMAISLEEVELTQAADDGYVHFGDVLQLVHVDTGAVIAGDVGDRDPRPEEQACSATAAPELRAPIVRNTLQLLRYSPPRTSPLEPEYDNDVVRYGQKVRLALNPLASGQDLNATGGSRPYMLYSKPPSMTHYAKYSRKQLVAFTQLDNFDCVWQIVTTDPAMRSLSHGVEVMAGAPILLVHCGTQKPLCIEPQKYPNDFGIELELTARPAINHGTKSGLEQASMGIQKSFLPKGESSDAHWVFVTGARVASLPVPQTDNSASDAVLRQIVGELSAPCADMLERKLVTLENSQCELMDEELLLIVRHVGSSITDEDVQCLAQRFRLPAKPGMVDTRALLKCVRAIRWG